MSTAKTVFHSVVAAHFWFGCFYDWNYAIIPVNVHAMGKTFGSTGKLKFLTYLDALLQSFFYTVCVINDVTGSQEKIPRNPPPIRTFKDTLLTCLAFPLSMFVGLTFWGLYAVDRELVLPKAVDPYFPGWLNHIMHTNIMIFMLIEFATSCRIYQPREYGLKVIGTFMMTYLVWIHIIYYNAGFWVYPVLEVLGLPMRIVFFGSLLSLTMALYIFGEKLNDHIWGKDIAEFKTD